MRIAIAAVGVMMAFSAAGPAAADENEAVKDAISRMSDEELLAEFQRRFDSQTLKPAGTRAPARGMGSPLAKFDDATLVQGVRATSRTIYGPLDRRMDWYEIKDEAVKTLAQASVALVKAEKTEETGGEVALKVRPLGEARRLCLSEHFVTQPSVAFCSGTLIRPDMVLTAGHCVREVSDDQAIPPATGVDFVFGYRMEGPDTGPEKVPAKFVYKGKAAIAGEKTDTVDWALVRLQTSVPPEVAVPITAWEPSPVAQGQKVFVIGYPSGLPLKYAPGAAVRDISDPGFFRANLDAFGGNSGSGVFDQQTGKLVGVLVRGDADYKFDQTRHCYYANVCPIDGCKGESVTRLSAVKLPQ